MSRRYGRLTPRLAQTLPMFASGKTDNEIAKELGLALATVRGLAARLIALYSATNRAHMIACAMRQGDLT